ncbi:hypothetical protein QJQ45_014048, partial [Haematococcus lacustris]
QLGLTTATAEAFEAEHAAYSHWDSVFKVGKLANRGFVFNRRIMTDGVSVCVQYTRPLDYTPPGPSGSSPAVSPTADPSSSSPAAGPAADPSGSSPAAKDPCDSSPAAEDPCDISSSNTRTPADIDAFFHSALSHQPTSLTSPLLAQHLDMQQADGPPVQSPYRNDSAHTDTQPHTDGKPSIPASFVDIPCDSDLRPGSARAKELWAAAGKKVQMGLTASDGFTTLRDKHSTNEITLKQLRTVKVLGEGAFATVELCEYTATPGECSRMVAVKKLKPAALASPEDLKSFQTEVALMRKLKHNAALQSLSSHLPGCGAGFALAALPWALWGSAAGSALVRLLRLAGRGVLGPGSEAAGCEASWLLRRACGGLRGGTTGHHIMPGTGCLKCFTSWVFTFLRPLRNTTNACVSGSIFRFCSSFRFTHAPSSTSLMLPLHVWLHGTRGIVEYVGIGCADSSSEAAKKASMYMVQEFMGGGTLKKMVSKQMRTPHRAVYSNADALRWTTQLAEAIAYLHAARPKVIHRDLKMDNVLLTEGEVSVKSAKLSDFGLVAFQHRRPSLLRASTCMTPGVPTKTWGLALARMSTMAGVKDASVKGGDLFSPQTLKVSHCLSGQTGTLMCESMRQIGQPCSRRCVHHSSSAGGVLLRALAADMSPEMFKEEPYTEAVDVFSFAVVMYELFHRYLMLHAISLEGTDEEVEAYAERVSNGFRPPIAPHLGPEFQSLLQQCWAQDPATRPRMDQVVQRLRQLQLEGLMGPGTEPQGCQCAIC